MKDISVAELEEIANRLRIHVVEMTTAAGSGHPGGSLSAADLMAVLYFRNLNHDPSNPQWEDRDRYFPVEDLVTLRKMGSKLQGHPVRGKVPGVEMSTGSLGQGLSMSCGIALAGRMDGKEYKTYCLLGDGELQSGQNWEAAMFASHNGLSNLIAIVDRNRLQITGSTEDAVSLEPLPEKWRAFGWNVIVINGHNIRQISEALDKAAESKRRPTVIIMNTIKGKGVSFMENNVGFHGKACNQNEYEQAMSELKGESE